ncbi:alkaline phosphatase family protein [Patescibacteria group bacterium]|nr:alkaline phosphatase family protein [Patescibacteria group bacterium]
MMDKRNTPSGALVFILLGALIFSYVRLRVQTVRESSPATRPVILIMMENTSWDGIAGNPNAPYINSLLRRRDAAYLTNYHSPAGIHPSEPNYVWLEAGMSESLPNGKAGVSFTSDAVPSPGNSTSTRIHLSTILSANGYTWKVYAEGISGTDCPLTADPFTRYAPKHVPQLFFQDVTGDNASGFPACIRHIRPLTEFLPDIAHRTIADYSVVIPNTCHDMHDTIGCESGDRIANGDRWLSRFLPPLLSSGVYQNNGAVFLTWDEDGTDSGNPIGLILLSFLSKGRGYSSANYFDTSSLVSTFCQMYALFPCPGHAREAPPMNILFQGDAVPHLRTTIGTTTH